MERKNIFLKGVRFRVWFPIVLIACLALGAGIYALYCFNFNFNFSRKTNQNLNQNLVEEPVLVPSPLDGQGTTQEKADRRPIAVMIENYPAARPPSGLSKAGLIYETVTEGGITRFMAVYQATDPTKIGPVRSARTFFVNFADELNAFYAHCGGNADAQALISSLSDFYDLDNFKFSAPYWRVSSRPSPHNLYTSTDKLRSAGEGKGYDINATFEAWQFKDEAPLSERPESASLSINFSSQSYNVSYLYDKASNSYLRKLNGKDHLDDDGTKIVPKNVVIQTTSIAAIPGDREKGVSIKTSGEGKALVFLDGKKIVATWKKIGRKGRTKYFDETGQEIAFNRGMTFVEIVSPSMAVVSEPL